MSSPVKNYYLTRELGLRVVVRVKSPLAPPSLRILDLPEVVMSLLPLVAMFRRRSRCSALV